jgi:hypothetical protein
MTAGPLPGPNALLAAFIYFLTRSNTVRDCEGKDAR